jgi:hypothetical protein
VIGDVRIAGIIKTQEAEHWKEHTGENQETGQGSAIPPGQPSESDGHRCQSGGEKILPPLTGIYLPPGIVKDQVDRPE